MNTTIQVRIDSKLKKDVSKIFESLGLDLSSGVKMFFTQVLVRNGLPFEALTENGYTHEQERKLKAIIKENEKLLKEGKLKIFDSWEEMEQDIMNEPD
ncbi:MAG: type II toxin-antitoxin system RelB/DinJ family antitoxin [Candidatus Magasanikbacteria bacterium]|nr:type II toxin-antitoxin system RelB/DinJ family antitoxin [Candidatus Magasanikbacteria bacterium]